ncbi:MAG: hypothetical protein KME26_18410 [Oscillatoria princeps RMCB-10]|nr:hypothetical protein [Oscillatoria princeps RMCB-10]
MSRSFCSFFGEKISANPRKEVTVWAVPALACRRVVSGGGHRQAQLDGAVGPA